MNKHMTSSTSIINTHYEHYTPTKQTNIVANAHAVSHGCIYTNVNRNQNNYKFRCPVNSFIDVNICGRIAAKIAYKAMVHFETQISVSALSTHVQSKGQKHRW